MKSRKFEKKISNYQPFFGGKKTLKTLEGLVALLVGRSSSDQRVPGSQLCQSVLEQDNKPQIASIAAPAVYESVNG